MYTYLGRDGNLLEETPKHAHLIKLKYPVISNEELEKLREVAAGDLRAVTLPMLFSVGEGEDGLKAALESLMNKAAEAVKNGASNVILSDRGGGAENAT